MQMEGTKLEHYHIHTTSATGGLIEVNVSISKTTSQHIVKQGDNGAAIGKKEPPTVL